MKYAYVKNQFLKLSDAKISIKERGFRFGDGVFETIRIKNYVLYDYELHLVRIKNGLTAIKIEFDSNIILDIANKLIKKNNQKNGFLRFSISRGVGSRGYYPTYCKPTLVIETENARRLKSTPINLGISSYSKISPKSFPVNYKLMQGMNSTLSLIEARDNGFFDAIMLNSEGNIVETTSANIFALKNGDIYSPSGKEGVLYGVTREKIINNFSVIEQPIALANIQEFDNLFITSVAIGAKKIESITEHINPIWTARENYLSQARMDKISKMLR